MTKINEKKMEIKEDNRMGQVTSQLPHFKCIVVSLALCLVTCSNTEKQANSLLEKINLQS